MKKFKVIVIIAGLGTMTISDKCTEHTGYTKETIKAWYEKCGYKVKEILEDK